jgi:hypothetical protein
MSDWIGLGVFVLVVVAAFLGLVRLGTPREKITHEEFERRVEEAKGTAGAAAALYSLQKLMNPKAAEAVEVLQDLKAGYYDEHEQAGEGDKPGDPKDDTVAKTDGVKSDV